jgi:hypothetical protein
LSATVVVPPLAVLRLLAAEHDAKPAALTSSTVCGAKYLNTANKIMPPMSKMRGRTQTVLRDFETRCVY